ncbi:MAG: S9 family peptidase [Flavobacteriaceae bacterium]|nr:S9 family peptidase [Flavobacteriaceae bacterium]
MNDYLKLKSFIVFTILLSINIIYSQSNNKFKPIDVFSLEYVSNPKISPDGKKVLYVRNFKDIMTDKNHSNIWIIDFDGKNNTPLTTGNKNDFDPTWSNSGDKFTYKSNSDDTVQLYLYVLGQKSNQKLTNLQNSVSSVDWSEDDKYLVFTSFVEKPSVSLIKMPEKPKGAKWNDPASEIDGIKYRSDGRGYLNQGFSQVFILPTEGGTPRQITFLNNNASSPKWLAKNKIIFSANLHEDSDLEPRNSEIYSINIISEKITPLTTRLGPDYSPVVSPDKKEIAYLGFDEKYLGYQQSNLYIMSNNGKEIRNISENFNRNISNINWSADGKGLYFQYDDKGMTKLAYMSISGKLKNIVDQLGGMTLGRPYSGGTYSISKNNRYAYTLGNVYSPSDLAVGYNTNFNRLTALNKDLFDHKELGNVEEVWFKSSFDERQIQGWLVKPPNFDPSKKYPLILEIHGGPFSNYGFRFSAEIQLFASKGYVVLYTNPRGSTSYGKEFANLIHHNYPNQDYDDLMSGVDHILKRSYVDEENLFVTGGSGGGVLTAWIIGKTNRFKAAVVAKPVINWYSFVLYADNINIYYKYWFPGAPWDNLEHYMKRSPISYVANVKTPTMLLTGEQDFRTPIAESEQFYAGLKLNKVESMLVRIPGASHGIAARPSNLITKVNAITAWFEKYRDE